MEISMASYFLMEMFTIAEKLAFLVKKLHF